MSHALGHTEDGDANAVKGAAGAFKLAGIGSEVSELEQKPGDFAQSRRRHARSELDRLARYLENTQVSSPGQPPMVQVPTSTAQSPSGRVRKPGTVDGGFGASGFANGSSKARELG